MCDAYRDGASAYRGGHPHRAFQKKKERGFAETEQRYAGSTKVESDYGKGEIAVALLARRLQMEMQGFDSE